MSNFDDYLDGLSFKKETTEATADIVTDTFNYGQKMIDLDYLPKIKKIPILKKYIKDEKEINLFKRGWTMNFGSSKEWAGLCSSGGSKSAVGSSKSGKNVFISIEFTKHDENWKDNMRGVVLHEIAHAISFEIFRFNKNNIGVLEKIDDLDAVSKGHGIVFKKICKAIKGEECRIFYENSKKKDSFKDYLYRCTFCGHVGFGGFPDFTSQCSECSKAVSTEKNNL